MQGSGPEGLVQMFLINHHEEVQRMKRASMVLKGLVMLLLVFGFVGCDTLESINPFGSEKEVTGIIEAIGDNALTVDGIEYRVTDKTEFEGFNSLADLAVGNEVEIEYEEDSSGNRTAKEIELAGG